MNVTLIFYGLTLLFSILIFILAIFTFYYFLNLDRELFKHIIYGLFSLSTSVIGFLGLYLIYPSSDGLRRSFFGFLMRIPSVMGVFFFVKATELLASKENNSFQKDQKLDKMLYILLLTNIFWNIPHTIALLSKSDLFNLINIITYVFFFSIVLLALKIILSYKKIFIFPLDSIVSSYTISIVLFIIGGIIANLSLSPVTQKGVNLLDFSAFRMGLVMVSMILIFYPFTVFYRSVSKLRKAFFN